MEIDTVVEFARAGFLVRGRTITEEHDGYVTVALDSESDVHELVFVRVDILAVVRE